jgi:hypothetical protein
LTQRRTGQRLPSGRICGESGQYQHTWKYLSEFFGYFAQASMPEGWVMYNIFKKYTWKHNTRKNQNINKKISFVLPEKTEFMCSLSVPFPSTIYPFLNLLKVLLEQK